MFSIHCIQEGTLIYTNLCNQNLFCGWLQWKSNKDTTEQVLQNIKTPLRIMCNKILKMTWHAVCLLANIMLTALGDSYGNNKLL